MIVLLNGAFGIGKTTVARALVETLPRAILFNPELIGIVLQRSLRLSGRDIYDFQDLRSWHQLTTMALRATRQIFPNIVVPMAFSNVVYLQEFLAAVSRFEPAIFHFCLVAPKEVVHERLISRGDKPQTTPWVFERSSECCVVHPGEEFATHIDAASREPAAIAEDILRCISVLRGAPPS